MAGSRTHSLARCTLQWNILGNLREVQAGSPSAGTSGRLGSVRQRSLQRNILRLTHVSLRCSQDPKTGLVDIVATSSHRYYSSVTTYCPDRGLRCPICWLEATHRQNSSSMRHYDYLFRGESPSLLTSDEVFIARLQGVGGYLAKKD